MTSLANVSVILLAGGTGSRMGTSVPKQYLPLAGKPVVLHSFELLISLPEVSEIVVVCQEQYQKYFKADEVRLPVLFAEPGAERQDSVYSGLQLVSEHTGFVCVHDGARPLLSREVAQRTIGAAQRYGAAAAAVPVKATIKSVEEDNWVDTTLDRSQLWEMQTPQVVEASLLREAFAHACEHGIEGTDDISIVEAYGAQARLVMGDYRNVKITTSADLDYAQYLLQKTQHLSPSPVVP